ncbi:MAG: hypothetical protein H6Q77_1960 [Gemmatimonadetes bacterium]|nr:hypothetical protein [Gemmatimonadota bacterium]
MSRWWPPARCTAFAAGLNVYATVAILGASQYFHLFSLPAGLGILGHPVVIFGSAALFFIEFFADKVPYVDTVWDSIHTLVRPTVAAGLSFGIFSGMPEAWKILAALMGGSVALTSHGAKAVTRTAANTSPEPFSNWILSVMEDAVAIGLTTLAMSHPVIAGAIAVVLVVLAVLVIRRVVRFFKRAFSGEAAELPTVPGPGS